MPSQDRTRDGTDGDAQLATVRGGDAETSAATGAATDPGQTLPLEDAPPRAVHGEPPAAWDRYEIGALLGKGAMGAVYRARDRRLDRTLAIKFLLGANPDLNLRFLREARAQARIDHPNVCRVYETGQVDGRPYIALQLVEGEPLHRAAARMSLEDKVAVMRDVAAAVQEAHRLGIVHRDLKPSNILVERGGDGRWLPVIMDFGLAREITTEDGLTESGAVIGTPAYMSPEQARGDIRAVDRRSDVYSLGATLYELLTGRPPFSRSSLADALAEVIHDDPPAPRAVAPSLPVDLETIALKCMAKDPAERYASARALADDLGRYLAGEPILGRRLAMRLRLRLWVRRHRALVVLGAWSLAAILVVGALGARQWLASRRERAAIAERTRLAERLGRDATEIEGALREAYLWPLHDTRPDRARVRDRMRAIRDAGRALDPQAAAIVHEALGRGHLALHEWSEANAELELAEAAGLDAPELHVARARALGELYRAAIEGVRFADDKAWRARQVRELEARYLAPALDELARSRASSGDAQLDAQLIDARVALYRRDHAAAEQRAGAVAERAPGLAEARKLAGDAAYGAALEDFDRGDYDAARGSIDRAAERYAAASEIARSDGSLHEAAAQAWLLRAETDLRQGRSARDPIDRALEQIDRALRADPDAAWAYTLRAEVLLREYHTPALTGFGDLRPLLERIAAAASRAVELDPRDVRGWNALGNAHLGRGTYEQYHGGQGAPWWTRALDDFGKALAIAPDDPRAAIGEGAAHRWLGDQLDQTGGDPTAEYQAALRSYERAGERAPEFVKAWSYQTDLHTTVAEHDADAGRDPGAAVERARGAGERCLAIDPHYYAVLHSLAQAHVALARYRLDSGGDPGDALTRARGYLDRADAARPDYLLTWYYRLAAAGVEARFRLRGGGDPSEPIAAGRAALANVVRLKPDSSDAHVEAARLDLAEAAWATRSGRPAAAALARARADSEKAIALDPQFADARMIAAEACLASATAQRSRETVDRGLAHVERALALNPRLRRAAELRTALDRLRVP